MKKIDLTAYQNKERDTFALKLISEIFIIRGLSRKYNLSTAIVFDVIINYFLYKTGKIKRFPIKTLKNINVKESNKDKKIKTTNKNKVAENINFDISELFFPTNISKEKILNLLYKIFFYLKEENKTPKNENFEIKIQHKHSIIYFYFKKKFKTYNIFAHYAIKVITAKKRNSEKLILYPYAEIVIFNEDNQIMKSLNIDLKNLLLLNFKALLMPYVNYINKDNLEKLEKINIEVISIIKKIHTELNNVIAKNIKQNPL